MVEMTGRARGGRRTSRRRMGPSNREQIPQRVSLARRYKCFKIIMITTPLSRGRERHCCKYKQLLKVTLRGWTTSLGTANLNTICSSSKYDTKYVSSPALTGPRRCYWLAGGQFKFGKLLLLPVNGKLCPLAQPGHVQCFLSF